MVAGESRRARRSGGEDPRGARAQDAGPAEGLARARRTARVLDEPAARLAAGDLLGRRAWTRATLAARLRRRGAPADVAAAVVADLSARGYVDDAAFARQWVAVRAARGYGTARLRAELRARGVDALDVDAALQALDLGDALERARLLAGRRLPTLRRGAPERVAPRLRDYLLRRGFGGAVTTRVVRELTGVVADD